MNYITFPVITEQMDAITVGAGRRSPAGACHKQIRGPAGRSRLPLPLGSERLVKIMIPMIDGFDFRYVHFSPQLFGPP